MVDFSMWESVTQLVTFPITPLVTFPVTLLVTLFVTFSVTVGRSGVVYDYHITCTFQTAKIMSSWGKNDVILILPYRGGVCIRPQGRLHIASLKIIENLNRKNYHTQAETSIRGSMTTH